MNPEVVSAYAAMSLFIIFALPGCAEAQRVPLSQHGTVSQRVAQTEIAIEYNRPVARGRQLFGPGAVVRYGYPWNPGADQATSIEFSDDVFIEGQFLPAGEYTLWAIPDQDRWIMIFSSATDVYHTPYPGERRDALRVPVTPVTRSHMEVMAFYFPEVGPDAATLMLHWGTTAVPIRIRLATE